MTGLPWTPDFDHWPIEHSVAELAHTDQALNVTWSDGAITRHHVLLLRENAPDPSTIHPKAREMAIAPSDIAADVALCSATVETNGAVSVIFSDGTASAYHHGWLRGTAWLDEAPDTSPVLWCAADLSEPPTFDGPKVLGDDVAFLQWLEALRDYGVARLRGLPQQDGLLERVATRIGPIRESNFGRRYVLEIKDDPDSQAFTADKLLQHIDLPTRETPFGLQFLFTRANTTSGGEGIYVDAYRIAEDMRGEEPEHFRSLCTDVWEYNNRSKVSDYRGAGPVVELDARGDISGIRYNTFLRTPMRAPLEVQARAYAAYRAFCVRAQNPRYALTIRYEPGDLVAFDNRRALHGRAAYDAAGGARFIEGIYSDRDELHARIRILHRHLKSHGNAPTGVTT